MKKTILWSVGSIFAMFLFTYSSCNSISKKDMYGAWEVQSAEIENIDDLVLQLTDVYEMNEEEEEEFKEEIITTMNEEFIGENFEFFKDNTLEIGGNKAEWELNSDNETITITENGDEFDFVINKLKNDKLNATLILKDDDFEISIIMTLIRQ